MPICKNCNEKFPNEKIIDGKTRNLSSRSYCLTCSPFKSGNTKKLHIKEDVRNCHKCGENDISKFYGQKKSICRKCHNEYTLKKGQEKREWAIKKLGGKCAACGFNKYTCSLEIHHVDPHLKDPNFSSMRGWSLDRIAREIETCICLCSNCHKALHSGFDIY